MVYVPCGYYQNVFIEMPYSKTLSRIMQTMTTIGWTDLSHSPMRCVAYVLMHVYVKHYIY